MDKTKLTAVVKATIDELFVQLAAKAAGHPLAAHAVDFFKREADKLEADVVAELVNEFAPTP
jgi:hypothetical protein